MSQSTPDASRAGTADTAPSMFDDQLVEALAGELYRSERDRTQIGQFSARFPGMTIEDGYRISRCWTDRKVRDGRRIVGRKIGLTSRAMQQAAGFTEPDYGTLLDDMVHPDGGDVPSERFIVPRVEVELAFVLGQSLRGPGVTLVDVLRATEYVLPAFEIIDARIRRVEPETGAIRRVQDTIADNAASAGVVLGGRPVAPDGVDLRWVGALLHRNGRIEETGVAAGVLNHPATGVAWLADRFGRWDEHLEPGEILLSGSFTRSVEIGPGDVVHADFGVLGGISFRLAPGTRPAGDTR